MLRVGSLLIATAVVTLPSVAKADLILEGSVGAGFNLKPDCCSRVPTNIMIAPGWGLGEMIRAELGLVASLADVENSDFDIQLRPMLVLDPPILPLYGRLIFGIFNLVNDADVEVAYGGALGLSLLGIVFAEAGVIPVGSADTVIFEGRVGILLSFD